MTKSSGQKMIIVARFHPDKSGQVLTFEKQIETDEMPFFSHFKCIHENPVRAGMVEKREDYMCLRARNYAGLEGLVTVDHW